MKFLYNFLFIIIITTGCKPRTQDIINTASIHFSGIFITENIKSFSSLRIEGRPAVKNETDRAYYVSGFLEGFSPLNYPVSLKHFSETLHYNGGDPNERKNWVCMEIYIDNKKMK